MITRPTSGSSSRSPKRDAGWCSVGGYHNTFPPDPFLIWLEKWGDLLRPISYVGVTQTDELDRSNVNFVGIVWLRHPMLAGCA